LLFFFPTKRRDGWFFWCCLQKKRQNRLFVQKYVRMKRTLFFLSFSFFSLAGVLSDSPALLSYDEPQDIVIYNRILAKVNGKTISVIDVMKKMDLFLQRYYPNYAQSK